MRSFTILFQLLGFYSRRAAANKWLRAPSQKRTQLSSSGPEPKRMRYLRVDAVPNTIDIKEEGWEEEEEGWEDEIKGEVMMELDQLGQLFEDVEESAMDIFEIEQFQDSEDEVEAGEQQR